MSRLSDEENSQESTSCLVPRTASVVCLLAPLVLLSEQPWLNLYAATSVVTALATWAILFNYPGLLTAFATRPFYYEDIPASPTTYRIFFTIGILLFTVGTVGLVDYYLFRFRLSKMDTFEFLGVMGGFLSLLRSLYRVACWIAIHASIHCHSSQQELSDAGDDTSSEV